MTEAHDLYRQTLAATGDKIAAIKAIRDRFGLNLREAKEVMLQAEGSAASVDEHEESFVPILEQLLSKKKGTGSDAAPDSVP